MASKSILYARRSILQFAAAGTVTLLSFPTLADDRISKVNGNAIKGYDTTAYFRHGEPRKGSNAATVKWKSATWRFASTAEADLFRANPEAYSPQFGGFCARAMSLGKIFKGDPEVWRIRGNNLYLFARPVGRDVYDKDPEGLIAKAEANWKKLK